MSAETAPKSDFIREIIRGDREVGKRGGRVQTRFPPEPNGFLHIGHAKSICLNFGLGRDFEGPCFLRFDDTNPATEEEIFIRSIQEDVRWLGFSWGENLRYASDYFERIYQDAERLIELGKAFVCELTAEQMREYRGVPGVAGKNSPFRDRPAAENLELFRRMRAGDFPDGSRTLRAKIDMASPNFNLRDPVLYRIKRDPHPRTGTAWVIYPMYDYAHALSDALEGTTHSICTLEFEDHRPLYDWFLETLGYADRPQQIEFARLEVTYLLTSKRKLKDLVETGVVSGWDDPRMPTLAGFRRRGVPPEALRDLCDRVGVAKAAQSVEIELLEHCIRESLDATAGRVMVVQKPLRVTLTNWPEGEVRWIDAPLHPAKPELGTRKIALARDLVIEDTDFMLDPPKKFFRLGPGREVRLRYGPIVRCDEVVKDDAGQVVELRCTFDEASLDASKEQRKVKGVIHWVAREHGVPVEVRNYDRLFAVPSPADVADGEDYRKNLNPRSLEILTGLAEPHLGTAPQGARFQFERTGYYVVERPAADGLVVNRTVGLRDSWAKVASEA
jgi:glutaminyl-tRNA synthetase